MSNWIINKKFTGDMKLKNPILVEGLPGIGNVGKLAVDFMIDDLKPNCCMIYIHICSQIQYSLMIRTL